MHRRDLIKYLLTTGSTIPFVPALAIFGSSKKEEFILDRTAFDNDFKWGVATAAYQTEGAWDAEGKGPSIWDTFTQQPRNVKDGTNGNIASDFYNRYVEDIKLLASLNFPIFRFSLSWSRIIPSGIGQRNQKGIDFYHRVIDECLKQNIEPWVTLYHWDLPQFLEDKGGWENREIVDWFGEYVDFCTREYGHKVNNWIILNEPMSFVGLGYFLGYHAPGRRGFKTFLKAAHHAALCQGEGGRIAKTNLPNANIGTTQFSSYVAPKNGAYRHKQAANKVDALLNRFFIEPLLGMGYPTDEFPLLNYIEKYYCPGDEERLVFDYDFIGIQYYYRTVARFSLFPPFVFANEVPAEKREVPTNEMGFEYYPEGIRQVVEQYWSYPDIPNLIISESGVCFDDEVVNGRVKDDKRQAYHQNVLKELQKMRNDGIPIDGYFVWTFTDNFEWADGYDPGFGLVYVDFDTQERIVKDSGRWFRDFLR
ncbi:MAG: beta-glucosidase [Bacteroidetes bacterium]|jgi:beta-glucosidase|nr:beta-glucosidase [Bacteroidota bacterium]